MVIFAHGFKGFKDWGAHNLVASHFAENGFRFLKFNFSHNGTTIDRPTEFTDLIGFSDNTFSIEFDDLLRRLLILCGRRVGHATGSGGISHRATVWAVVSAS